MSEIDRKIGSLLLDICDQYNEPGRELILDFANSLKSGEAIIVKSTPDNATLEAMAERYSPELFSHSRNDFIAASDLDRKYMVDKMRSIYAVISSPAEKINLSRYANWHTKLPADAYRQLISFLGKNVPTPIWQPANITLASNPNDNTAFVVKSNDPQNPTPILVTYGSKHGQPGLYYNLPDMNHDDWHIPLQSLNDWVAFAVPKDAMSWATLLNKSPANLELSEILYMDFIDSVHRGLHPSLICSKMTIFLTNL